jgi:hypothetical protein
LALVNGRRVGRHQHVQFAEPISNGPAIEADNDLARGGVNIVDVADITIVDLLVVVVLDSRCPVPTHNLRNGHLNQLAYSLYLFIRDIADGDLIGWIEHRLRAASSPAGPDRLARMRNALIAPLRGIYGVSDKVLTMALSSLLLGAPNKLQLWREVGASMIAIDTLVHNFLHRTGILHRFGADHAYGAPCYRPGGCAEIIEVAAERIDASAFNPAFPAVFPRFVQHAIWRYCAQTGLDVCNGNRIDGRKSCENVYCQIHNICDRIALYN